jgi:two-component system, NarL family, nitrate/nitrite response regulator NarP
VNVAVAIADKNPLVLSGLRSLFNDDQRFTLVATATDGERFLDVVRRYPFDVGVIGWEMPFKSGREVLEALRDVEHAPRIVVYTGAERPGLSAQVMAMGGAGFVGKREPPEHLLDVVLAVASGRMVFPFVDVRRARENPLSTLSPRERQLLEALGSGRTNAELARSHGVSINTVKFHLRNLFEKLGIRNRAHAVRLWHDWQR